MGKAFFRFLRGELNGFYITNINGAFNEATNDIKSFFVAFARMQFNLLSMPAQTIYNIGTFAGVYIPRLSAGERYGAMRMTESEIVDGEERSTRGLLRREDELFEFVHTEQEDYPDDINTLATPDLRSGVTGDEPIQGYIASNDYNALDNDGNVREESILSSPPQGQAYTDFYGNQFMFLSDQLQRSESININVFIELYKVMQYIRYNGVNIQSLANLVAVLCPDGFLKIDRIVRVDTAPCFNVYYRVNLEESSADQLERLSTFKYIVELKFQQFTLVEIDT
jgi:hypothetical protein